MIDFIISALITPGPAWVGTALGIVAAGLVWYFFPESTDRASLAGWLVGLGFVGGILWAAIPEKKKHGDT